MTSSPFQKDAVPVFEEGSFRDSGNQVFYYQGEVYRLLNAQAADSWHALSQTRFFAKLVNDGKVIGTRQVEAKQIPHLASKQNQVVLKHDKVPCITYPYEWTFGMLKDAALLTLELMEAALAEEFILQDATPYNIQWQGSFPVFIDLPSFVPRGPGDFWRGTQQFYEMFLYPLFLTAYKNVPFQPWLRGSLEGISLEHMGSLISRRDLFRPGIFKHVYLQKTLRKILAKYDQAIRGQLKEAKFTKKQVLKSVCELKRLVKRLDLQQKESTWSNYTRALPYSTSGLTEKDEFVKAVVQSKDWNVVWDLGCNTGKYSHLAAEKSPVVLAMDADFSSVEVLYHELKAQNNRRILPLYADLTDPSPNLGWNLDERKALGRRSKPDLIFSLALVHHLSIARNVPLESLARWFRSFNASLIMEFVGPEDPMAKRLLQDSVNPPPNYNRQDFEEIFFRSFAAAKTLEIAGGTRVLYFLEPK